MSSLRMTTLLRAALILLALLALAFALLALNSRALIYHPDREQVAPDLPGVEAVRIETQDGERIVAWWRAPPEEHAPVFLFFDGNGGRPQIQEGRWRRIVEGGAGFLAVYYRGYSGSTGTPTEQGLYRDGRAGYDWLIARGFAPDDIIIHGFSLGSGVAVRLASERQARALILEAPFTGVDDVAAEMSPIARFAIRDRFASREIIGAVAMPILIAHGDGDTVVPYAQGQRLFALAPEPKTFARMEGSDHSTLVRDGIYDRIWRFLQAHQGGSHGQSRTEDAED
jgi:uncharacterized protein